MKPFDPLLSTCLADAGALIPALVIIGFIAIVALIIGGAWWWEKKRTEQLERLAGEIGLPFYPLGDDSLVGSLNHFYLFSQGRNKKIRNMLHGKTNDVEMAIFDYAYTVGSGKNSSTPQQSVVYFRSPLLALPHFAMRPEWFFHKIGTALGYQDIDFESHPQFSGKYLLRGSDEAAIRSLFHADLLTFLESQHQISIDGGGNQMVFYRHSKRIKPDEIRDLMQRGFEVYAQLRGAAPEEAEATAEQVEQEYEST